MSLQLAAQHLAHHGRGDDKMLVHMTPKEVSGLQQLAQMHGGSLTVNPHTGLPEAGFLDSLLPTIIGAGLTYFSGGVINPMMAAGLVGGVQAARTGDIGKGLLAGLGAYGGAGLTSGFAEAGANAMTTAGVGDYASTLADRGIQAGTSQFGEEAGKIALDSQKQAFGASMGDKLSAGYTAATASPSAAMEFAKNNYKSGLAAVAPIVADQMVQTTTPPTDTAQIHPFRYAGGRYERLPAVSADKFQGFADGGMAQDNAAGGGMFNYAQMQPAVDLHPNSGVSPQNMAEGGVAHFDWGGEVTAAVNAGRMGFAPGTSAQDVVSSFNLNQDQAAQVAQQLGYTGDIKGLNYGSAATAAPVNTTPDRSAGWQGLQGAENTLYPTGQSGTQALGGTPATATAPVYTSYTNQDYGNFFNDPANAAVLQTPGGLAAAEAKFHADPNAVLAYLQNNRSSLGLSGGDIYTVNAGKGVQGVYDSMDQWVAAHPNATAADITTALKTSDLNDKDVQNYFNRSNDKYGKNLATGKAFTGAADIWSALAPGKDQGGEGGLKQMNANIQNWVATHLADKTSLADAQNAMTAAGINELDVIRATGKNSSTLYHDIKAGKPVVDTATTVNPLPGVVPNITSGLSALPNTPASASAAPLVPNPYGNGITPGDITFNANGSKTIQPNIPYRGYGGFTGMNEVNNAYTKGGGSTKPANLYVPKSVEELNAKYKNTGGSQQMLDYLSGKTTENPILHPITPTGEISKDYATSIVGLPEQDSSQKAYTFNPTTKKMMRNPDFIPTSYDSATGAKVYGKSINQIRTDFSKNSHMSDVEWLKYINDNHLEPQQIADATGVSLGEVLQHIQTAKGSSTGSGVGSTSNDSGGGGGGDGGDGGAGDGGAGDGGGGDAARGGIMYAAMGGQMYSSGGIGDLGGYSDGGRLLRGPGDGVSDSIPATIGQGKPARLADGEFVVPARIVSELGNGSTEAGARKLYAMMDRVQNTRGKTIGKGKVATNTRADKFLPA